MWNCSVSMYGRNHTSGALLSACLKNSMTNASIFFWSRFAIVCLLLLLRDRSVGVLRHACEVDGDLSVAQHPAVGEAHLGLIGARTHGDGLHDHQRLGIVGLRPERDVGVETVDAEDALHVLLQLL